jgi:PPOX class probable F420-dependent enzyme
MIDFTTPIGRKIKRRLRTERIIWLTTIDSQHTPQPRPVWFHWDGATLLIFSQADVAKVRHIKANPRVALNFNTDAEGGEVGVLIGKAVIAAVPVPATRWQAYVRKYRAGIKDLNMTPAQMAAAYSVPILVTPISLRGF